MQPHLWTADINSQWHSILGTREFPFTYQLPVDLPESLEDSRYATINYTVKRFPFIENFCNNKP